MRLASLGTHKELGTSFIAFGESVFSLQLEEAMKIKGLRSMVERNQSPLVEVPHVRSGCVTHVLDAYAPRNSEF